MDLVRHWSARLLTVLVMMSAASVLQADEVRAVTGWAVHNGTSTASGTADHPIFTPGDNLTLMAPFTTVPLQNDGDFIEGKTTLTMNARTTTGINSLNTQLRFGLFNGPSGAIADSDVPNQGFIIEYTNLVAGGLIREQQSAVQTNPFTSPTNIGNGTQDSGADSIQGANPGAVTFTLRLTRNAGLIDLTGSITGTDSVSGNPYVATYSKTGYSSTVFPANGLFNFNRMGVFLGGNVDAGSAEFSNTTVTVTPEPMTMALPAVIGSLLVMRRTKRVVRA
jgi:hypothetical protein